LLLCQLSSQSLLGKAPKAIPAAKFCIKTASETFTTQFKAGGKMLKFFVVELLVLLASSSVLSIDVDTDLGRLD